MNSSLKTDYETAKPLYTKLAVNICEALNTLLSEKNISFLSINHRIKSFDSLSEKIDRKKYKKHIEEIDDICGIRVIAYFPDDVIKIDEVIKNEFDIHQSEVKLDQLNNDQFGYRSDHFVVSIKNSWFATPNFRSLKDLKAEIQVRTILMHAWADLSHKLAYKSKETTPPQFLRNINQLSALFELADERFEHLRSQKMEHISKMTQSANLNTLNDFVNCELNVDTLQAYLNFRFPDRKTPDKEDSSQLINMITEMNEFYISLEKLDEFYKKCEPYLDKMEKMTIPTTSDFDRWAQLGMVRMILSVMDENYRGYRTSGDPALKKEMDPIYSKFVELINQHSKI